MYVSVWQHPDMSLPGRSWSVRVLRPLLAVPVKTLQHTTNTPTTEYYNTPWTHHKHTDNRAVITRTCLMLKLDTDMIMVGLLQISSGRTQREKMAFCLGDSASFPILSLEGGQRRFKSGNPPPPDPLVPFTRFLWLTAAPYMFRGERWIRRAVFTFSRVNSRYVSYQRSSSDE